MNIDLSDEITSINAIFDSEVLSTTSDHRVVLLEVPHSQVKLRISIPEKYPELHPIVEGTESSGQGLRKGQAAAFSQSAQTLVQKNFRAGEPCFFGLVEELTQCLPEIENEELDRNVDQSTEREEASAEADVQESESTLGNMNVEWTLSEVITEKKSVFVARTTRVHDPDEARSKVRHLLLTDKKAAKATHNITAWRIRDTETGVVHRDCDDDGESAAGGRMLHLLELMDVWNVIIVVTRWYGGVHLGPDRFRIINTAARDAIVKAGFLDSLNKPDHRRKYSK